MNIARSLVALRNVFDQNLRVENPSKIATAAINTIMSELRGLMDSNYVGEDKVQYTLYKDISSDRLAKFLDTLSFSDSTDLVQRELGYDPDMQSDYAEINLPNGVCIKPPEVYTNLPLASITTSNMYQYVFANSLDWMYGLLHTAANENINVDDIVRYYNDLNHVVYFNSEVKFEMFMKSCEPGLRNIIDTMYIVLRVILKERSRLQIRLEQARQLDLKNSELAQKSKLILEELLPDETVYYKRIILGSDSMSSEHGDSWICGNCGIESRNEKSIVSIDTRVYRTHMSRQDITGYVKFAANQCPVCGKYNILPGELIHSFIDLIADRNSGVGEDGSISKQGQIVDAGAGIYFSAIDHLQDLSESAEDPIMREVYLEDFQDCPEIVEPSYVPIWTIQDACDEELVEWVRNSLTDLDRSMKYFDNYKDAKGLNNEIATLENHVPESNSTEMGIKNDLSCDEDFQKYYGGHVKIREDGKICLCASKMFIGFCKLMLTNSADGGYTRNDLLVSLCSPDSQVFDVLSNLRNLILLKNSVIKLASMLNDLGFIAGSRLLITPGMIRNMYAEICENFPEFNNFLPCEAQKLDDICEGIDLTPVNLSDFERVLREQEAAVIEQINDMGLSKMVQEICKRKAYSYFGELLNQGNISSRTQQTGKTFLLSYCLDCADYAIESAIAALEDEVLSILHNIAEDSRNCIKVGDYTYTIKSPIYILSSEFKDRIADSVFYRMLKNTLYPLHLERYFDLSWNSNRKDPLTKYNNEMKRILFLLKRPTTQQVLQSMFYSVFTHCYNKYILKTEKDDWFTYYPNGYTKLSGIVYKIPPIISDDVYYRFISELWCDWVNIQIDCDFFKYTTYLDDDLLDLYEDSNIDYSYMSGLAMYYGMPESSDVLYDDTVSYLIKRCNMDKFDVVGDTGSSIIWQSDLDEGDQDFGSRRIQVLDNLKLYHSDYLPEDVMCRLQNDMVIYDVD